MEKITKEELIQKYGEVELKFEYYYKYCFNFKAELENMVFNGTVGGNSDDIYRYELSFDEVVKVKDFEMKLNALTVKNTDGELFAYDDF